MLATQLGNTQSTPMFIWSHSCGTESSTWQSLRRPDHQTGLIVTRAHLGSLASCIIKFPTIILWFHRDIRICLFLGLELTSVDMVSAHLIIEISLLSKSKGRKQTLTLSPVNLIILFKIFESAYNSPPCNEFRPRGNTVN